MSIWLLSRFSLLTVKSYFMHLLLALEFLNAVQVLLNLNNPTRSFVKPVTAESKDMVEIGMQREERMRSCFMVPQINTDQ